MRLIEAEPRNDDSRLVASFEAEFPSFRLAGCVIVLDAVGKLSACLPEARSRTKDASPIAITDPMLRRSMQASAVRLFETMTNAADRASANGAIHAN